MNNQHHLLIFGATGRTGIRVVEIALEKGYAVTAVVRNPAALKITHPCLLVHKGDILQAGSFQSIVHGKDAVISCIGESSAKPTRLFSDGLSNVLSAMERSGVKRLVCMSASGIEVSPEHPFLLRLAVKYILQQILKNAYADIRRMEKLIRDSNTDWTIVRPPRLTNGPLTGKYRFAINGYLKKCYAIRRADLAHFIVNNIMNPEMYRAVVEVAN